MKPKKFKQGFQSKKQKERLEKIKGIYNDLTADKEKKSEALKAVKLDHSYFCVTDFNADHDVIIEEVATQKFIASNEWSQGRRVVELDVLAKALSSCTKCGLPLQLSHTISCKTYGLAAILKIPCYNTLCNTVNNIPTGKRHQGVWDSNSKLATAMVHSGIGGRQVNFLSALNIPPVSNTLLTKREKEISDALETVAEASFEECLAEELRLSEREGNEDGMEVSVDGGWQKRGSGKGFDSLSGHCSMVGKETGKIVGYGVRSKFCKTCDNANRQNKQPKDHDCRKNWIGSAKAMEQDIVIDMLMKAKEKGAKITTIIADDDTTTISRIRKHINPDIKKKSDKNHVKKNIGNALYALRSKHKKLQNTKILKYIQKCINYMLSQNQGDQKGIEHGLEAISRHPFGDHSHCQSSWCQHKENPNAKYAAFPYRKCLNDIPLQLALSDLFKTYKQQSHKLANLGSTQANESFNKSVASKAPKSQFYSGSASLNRRCASAVAQKNLDTCEQICRTFSVYHTRRLSVLCDIQAKKRKMLSVTKNYKLRRIQLKSRRNKSNAVTELREGESYNTNIDLQQQEIQQDITEIPPPRIPPEKLSSSFDATSVCFDLETTGLGRTSHIVQIAAVSGDKKFDCYVMPKIPFDSSASDITGITKQGNQLFHNGKNVEAKSITDALDDFLTFLSNQGNSINLYGHNIKTFDCHVLFNALEKAKKMDKFKSTVSSFMDTKLLLKSQFPGLPSYSQQSLITKFLNEEYAAHNAIEDVSSLQKLVCSISRNEDSIKKSIFSVEQAVFFCKLEA